MKKSNFTSILLLLFLLSQLYAQTYYNNQQSKWLEIAKHSEPTLLETIKRPISMVSITEDSNAFQGYKTENTDELESFYTTSMKKNSGTILDFGDHLTGYVTFTIKDLGRVVDAALRLKFTFAEMPAEAVLPFDPYKGQLSRAWLQDEIVTISDVPATLTIPRRVSFRYVKIEVLGSSPFSDFKLVDIFVKATTSAKNQPEPLAPSTSEIIKKIDKISQNTLKECMQTVYEDGPKRDKRLWIGDLYLESLANQYTFKNDSLTKHCLYLLAGLCYPDGVVPATVFERPEPHRQDNKLFDYSLIYNVVLKEYVQATGDKQTAIDLWPVVKRQIKIPKKYLLENGMLDYETANEEWWLFFDWNQQLNKQASMMGCVIWAYKNTYELAKMIGKEKEVIELPNLIKTLSKAAHKNLYDKKMGVFVSGVDKQVSFASQAWMTLSGVASKKEAAKTFKNLTKMDNVIYPEAPYLYHYVIEGMIKAGLDNEARDLLVDYWGGMVDKGADTFWEVYVPTDDFASPYNSFLVNSYCHAWSCTPSYFIRKYPEIFQK